MSGRLRIVVEPRPLTPFWYDGILYVVEMPPPPPFHADWLTYLPFALTVSDVPPAPVTSGIAAGSNCGPLHSIAPPSPVEALQLMPSALPCWMMASAAFPYAGS